MIDWVNLGFNALWIVACSLALAAFSYASWEASVQKVKTRAKLSEPSYGIVLNLAGVIFCIGLAGTSSTWWEILLWVVMAALFAYQTFTSWRLWKK